MTRRPLVIALLLLAGAAEARDRPDWRTATPSGPAVDCIRRNQIRESRVRDDRTIDFYMNGRTVYRNVLPQGCPSLGAERRFGYVTSINQLCSVDIITVLFTAPNLQRGASCGLGKFQPVTDAPR